MYFAMEAVDDNDEDLHQCGRCRAMFRRLIDYFAHKQSRSCYQLTCLNAEVQTSPISVTVDLQTDDCQTSPQHFEQNFELSDVIGCSLQVSQGSDNPLGDDRYSGPVPPPPTSPRALAVGDEQEDMPIVVQSNTDRDIGQWHSPPKENSSSEVISELTTVDADSTSTRAHAGQEQLTVSEPQPEDDNVVAAVGMPEPPPPYKCPLCEYTSKFCDDFDQHLRRQHSLSCHVCVDCSRAFTDAYKLRRHQRLFCTKTPVRKKQDALLLGQDQLQLQLAPKFMALDKRKKVVEEASVLFSCQICAEEFHDYDEIQRHVTAMHSALARPGICRFCGAWFSNPYKLRRHVSSTIHDDIPSDAMTSFKQQVNRMSISCTPEALKLLRRARAERRQKQLAVAGNANECVICRQTFSARSALLRHSKVVHGRRASATAEAAPTISCQLCGASFDRRRAYLRHRRDAHRKLPVVRAQPATRKCLVCDRSFKCAKAAARHHATVHTAHQQVPDDAVTCAPSLSETATGDTETMSKCFVCAQSSPTHAKLVHHLELFHRVWIPLEDGPVPPGLFDDMPAIPPSLRNIDESLVASHAQHFGHTPSQSEPDVSSQHIVSAATSPAVHSERSKSKDTSSASWSCPYCHRVSFNTLSSLYQHKVEYHRLEAVFRCVESSCRLIYRTTTDYQSHVCTVGHRQAAFICSVCNEHFPDILSLLSHRGSAHRCHRRLPSQSSPHTDGMTADNTTLVTTSKPLAPILCDQCGQTFSKRQALRRHRTVVHKSESSRRRYACSQCDRRFVKREHLQRHVLARHSTARPYVCQAAGCGRAFKRKDKLQEHWRCHSTDRRYACSVCGRTYRQRDGLRQHARNHHKPTPTEPERRHRCRRCSASFTCALKLSQHLRAVHGRGAGKDVYAHRCDTCGKTFPRPERVRRHAEREHNVPADWSHKCTVCGKGFAGLRSYELHMARHRAEGNSADSGQTSARRCQPSAKSSTTTTSRTTTTTTEPSPRVVVVSGRHHHASSTATCEVSRLVAARSQRRSEAASTSHNFNRFFVPSTPSGHQSCDQAQPSHGGQSRSRLNAHQSTTLERLYCPVDSSTTHQTADRLDSDVDNVANAHRRLSFESLPYLHHPTNANHDYSYYTSGYHRHSPTHRTQFGLYPPSARTGFGYASHSATPANPRGCALFPTTDRAAAALSFGMQSADSCLTGQAVDRRASELSAGLATAFPPVMAPDYGSGPSAAPIRPLATQPPAPAPNAYCPVPDPPSVGRWFDSVPTLLPPPVDTANLDSVRWPPRHCIDTLTVRPRYPFGVTPGNPHSQQTATSRSGTEATHSVPGVDHSCLLNCDRIPPAVDCAGSSLMLASRRGAVNGDDGRDTMALYGGAATGYRDAGGCSGVARGATVPPHGMLTLLPPW